MCEYDDLFHVAGCEKGQLLWRNHTGSQELKSHCNMSGLLFYVKYALCISTTIKGIETFSTMCNWDVSRVNNVFEYFASCRVSASLCSVDVHVFGVFTVHGWFLKPTAAAKLSCMMLSRRPSHCGCSDPSTHTELSISPHMLQSILSIYPSPYAYFFRHVLCVSLSHTHTHTCQGHSDCFLIKSNVTVISENVPVYWMSVWRGHAHIRWPMVAVQKKLNKKKKSSLSFLCFNRVLNVVLKYFIFDPWINCFSCQH